MVQTRSITKKILRNELIIHIKTKLDLCFSSPSKSKELVICIINMYEFIQNNIEDFVSFNDPSWNKYRMQLFEKKNDLLEQLYKKMDNDKQRFTTYDMKALRLLQQSCFNKLDINK
jgi:hypothetical protein